MVLVGVLKWSYLLEPCIGGGYRVCLLDDEMCLAPSLMRCTGDRGRLCEGGQAYFAGRLDRQIKRKGHRLNLDYIEQVPIYNYVHAQVFEVS